MKKEKRQEKIKRSVNSQHEGYHDSLKKIGIFNHAKSMHNVNSIHIVAAEPDVEAKPVPLYASKIDFYCLQNEMLFQNKARLMDIVKNEFREKDKYFDESEFNRAYRSKQREKGIANTSKKYQRKKEGMFYRPLTTLEKKLHVRAKVTAQNLGKFQKNYLSDEIIDEDLDGKYVTMWRSSVFNILR